MHPADPGWKGKGNNTGGRCPPRSSKVVHVAVAIAALVSLTAWLSSGPGNTSRTSVVRLPQQIERTVRPVALGQHFNTTLVSRGAKCTECAEDGKRGNGLVLIKSFKTGSTTLATYIAQVGHQRESNFLHPRAAGWFARGELESRRDNGERFDISIRHITPYTPYSVMEDLVPGAMFVTIMRDPYDRFMSLFNFRGELKRKFKTPMALVSAIRAGKLSAGDARPFCNQLAWLMSGQDVDYTGVVLQEDANRVADAVIAEANRRGVTVLMTDRMPESVAILADLMGWSMDDLKLKIGSHRVQNRSGKSHSSCRSSDCTEAIRGCNLIDGILFSHYEQKFDLLTQHVPDAERVAAAIRAMPAAKKSMSRLDLGSFPVNCIQDRARTNRGGTQGEEATTELYNRLHACSGRP